MCNAANHPALLKSLEGALLAVHLQQPDDKLPQVLRNTVAQELRMRQEFLEFHRQQLYSFHRPLLLIFFQAV